MAQNIQIFPRSRRLCSPADYQYVFNCPAKYSTRYFTILYRTNGMSHARLGLAISKKIIKKAVDRNRLKRLIRESFRLNQQNLGAYDVIVLAKREVSTVQRGNLFEKQTNLWTALTRK